MLLILSALPQNANESDKNKLEQLYVKYRNMLFCYALRIMKNREDAEDVLHTAFIKIAKNIRNVEDTESRETASYLIMILKSTAYDFIKGNKHKEEVSIENIGDIAEIDKNIEKLAQHMVYEKIVLAIRNIPSPYNETLYLHYVRDFTVAKTAKLLDRKVSTVKMQLVRGKKLLLEALSEVQYD